MNSKLTKFAQAATLGLAITLTLNACEEKGGGTFTDTRDNKTYKTVKIGEQVWMAENLNYEAKGSICYDEKTENCKKYGRLYDWETAMKACPSGWHLPSNAEWKTLVDFAGSKVAGNKLKAKSGWNENGNGTDDFGFTALPSGGSDGGSFYNVGGFGGLWSSTEFDALNASSLCIFEKYNDAFNNENLKSEYISIRCIKD